jgi:SAM-dependent methyltransferase
MLTRWEAWFSQSNLDEDKRILAAPSTQCAKNAAAEFLRRRKQLILDLACGVGRDTYFLKGQGLSVIGVDASFNGLKAARNIKGEPETIIEFVTADARSLPFEKGAFDGIYCFGLLHEFVGADKEVDVRRVITEIGRLLRTGGILAIAMLAGNPDDGLPHVQLFSQQMFESAMSGWKPLEIRSYDDVGCTNQSNYHIWYGLFER